jgi:hypothetical protein
VTRGQRRMHRITWWVLMPVLLAVALWSLVDRWRVPASEPPPVLLDRGEAP